MALKTGKNLWKFVGILSKESAESLENAIKERRKRHAETRKARIRRIVEAFNDQHNNKKGNAKNLLKFFSVLKGDTEYNKSQKSLKKQWARWSKKRV